MKSELTLPHKQISNKTKRNKCSYKTAKLLEIVMKEMDGVAAVTSAM